jgi:hypothetical protein
LTPECFFLMTKALLTCCASKEGKDVGFVVALEGGYNLDVIPLCMEAVAMALIGEDWDEDGTGNNDMMDQEETVPGASLEVVSKLTKSRLVLSKYWNYFEPNERSRGKNLSKTACASINRTIKCLKDFCLKELKEFAGSGSYLKDCAFRLVKEQTDAPDKKLAGTRGRGGGRGTTTAEATASSGGGTGVMETLLTRMKAFSCDEDDLEGSPGLKRGLSPSSSSGDHHS